MSVCSSNITNDLTPFSSKEVNKSTNSLSIKNNSFIQALCRVLLEEIEVNEFYHHFPKKDCFYSENNTSKSIEDLISKLFDELEMEKNTLILSYFSMKKLLRKNKNYLSLKNFEKIFLTSCYINSKFNEDLIYGTENYSKICELTKDELIFLENEYCEMIDFELFVNEELFEEYSKFFSE